MKVFKITVLGVLSFMAVCAGVENAYAQFSIGADLVSRYVFRGTDFGNSASIQPTLSYAAGGFEIGAWGSYAITAAGAGANENDLYISYSSGPFGLVLTDYYFPEGNDFFEYSDDAGVHILEIGGSYSAGVASLSAFYNFSGDDENSFYTELGIDVPYEVEDIGVSLFAGFGNGLYTTDTDFNAVNLGITVSSGPWSASYILNPEAETNFLVFGRSF